MHKQNFPDQNPEDLKKGIEGRSEDSNLPPEITGHEHIDLLKDGKNFKEKYRPITNEEYMGDGVTDDMDEEDTDSPAV